MHNSQFILSLAICLAGSDPPVLRIVDTPSWFDFEDLHVLIQHIMPWENRHLFEFEVFRTTRSPNGIRIGPKLPDSPAFDQPKPDFYLDQVRLSDLPWTKSLTILYTYDLGNEWRHTIHLIEKRPLISTLPHPFITHAQHPAPPEDVGSIHHYQHLLEAWYDRSNPAYYDARQILGNRFKPKPFNLEKTNKQIRWMNEIHPSRELRLKPELIFPTDPPPKPRSTKKKQQNPPTPEQGS